MAEPNVEPSKKSMDRITPDHSDKDLPFVDIIALWQNASDRFKTKAKPEGDAGQLADVTRTGDANQKPVAEGKVGVEQIGGDPKPGIAQKVGSDPKPDGTRKVDAQDRPTVERKVDGEQKPDTQRKVGGDEKPDAEPKLIAEKKPDIPNRWIVSGQVKPGVDRLALTSEYRVSAEDFKTANPGSDLAQLDPAGRFKLKHPTTGAVDDGWKVKAQGKDGSVTMTRDFDFDVQSRKDHSGVLEAMPGVPASFIKHVQNKIDQMPPNAIASLERNGYKIIAAATIPDAMPELEKLTPRGWPVDSKFINSDGTHDDVSKRIIAPMRFIPENDIEPVMRENVVTHQVGHALDFAHGFLSAKPEFIDAYNKDMNALKHDIRHMDSPIVKYLSQPNGVGRQETFASIFGLVTTGPENESDRKFLTDGFPNVIKVVEKQIKELK